MLGTRLVNLEQFFRVLCLLTLADGENDPDFACKIVIAVLLME